MNKYELINSIIVDLNNLTVQGVENMTLIIDSIQRLSGLKDGLKQMDEATNKEIADLRAKVGENNVESPAE